MDGKDASHPCEEERMLLDYMKLVEDRRRGQGRRYDLAHVLLFTVMALLSGATSYRDIATFIETHFAVLTRHFGLRWKRRPSYTGLRDIIQGVSPESLEAAFRLYSAAVAKSLPTASVLLACDGKELRGSFDHMEDQRAAQLLSVFATDSQLILAHMEIPEKTNEIPAFQSLIATLGLTGKLFTLDAMHAQKNTSRHQRLGQLRPRTDQRKPEATAG
jgi:hypothetical protein